MKEKLSCLRTALKQVQEHLLLHLVKGRDGWPKMDGWMDAWNGSEIAENGWMAGQKWMDGWTPKKWMDG